MLYRAAGVNIPSTMRMAIRALLLVALWATPAAAQSIAGDWALTLHDPFGPGVMRLSLAINGETVSGSAGGRPVDGTFTRGTLTFKVRNATATATLGGAEPRPSGIGRRGCVESPYRRAACPGR